MAERKAVIKNADMSEDMQQDAVDCASQALEKYNIEKVSFCIILFYGKELSHSQVVFSPHFCATISSGYCCSHQEGI